MICYHYERGKRGKRKKKVELKAALVLRDARLGREKLKSLCYESVGGLPLLLGPRDEVRRTEDGRGWHMKGNAFQRRRFPPLPMENADENEDSGLHYVPHFAQVRKPEVSLSEVPKGGLH